MKKCFNFLLRPSMKTLVTFSSTIVATSDDASNLEEFFYEAIKVRISCCVQRPQRALALLNVEPLKGEGHRTPSTKDVSYDISQTMFLTVPFINIC